MLQLVFVGSRVEFYENLCVINGESSHNHLTDKNVWGFICDLDGICNEGSSKPALVRAWKLCTKPCVYMFGMFSACTSPYAEQT